MRIMKYIIQHSMRMCAKIKCICEFFFTISKKKKLNIIFALIALSKVLNNFITNIMLTFK